MTRRFTGPLRQARVILPSILGAQLRRGLGFFRDRAGGRLVNLPPTSGIGVGNMFSFWLWADAGRRRGLPYATARTEAMEPWLEQFPAVRELLLDRDVVRLRDQRTLVWAQEFDRFTLDELEGFIRDRLLTGPRMPSAGDDERDEVTVNVRRGDYYSDPRWRPLYGFDVAAYVRRALDIAEGQRPVARVKVISDDIAWCEENLRFLQEGGRQVAWHGPRGDPMDHFVRLCRARRLILANSSFSYWGAYVSTVLHGDNHDEIIAPAFHRRDINDGRAWQLDPRWTIVEDIPGGWKEVG